MCWYTIIIGSSSHPMLREGWGEGGPEGYNVLSLIREVCFRTVYGLLQQVYLFDVNFNLQSLCPQ